LWVVQASLRRLHAAREIGNRAVQRLAAPISHAALSQDVFAPRLRYSAKGEFPAPVNQGLRGEDGKFGVVGASGAVVHLRDDAVPLAVVVAASQIAHRITNRESQQAACRAVEESVSRF
jgi:hypothetical protein